MRPFRIERPITALVPFEGPGGLKEFCRLDIDEEEELFVSFERAAVDYLDGYSGRLGRCILRQTWAIPLNGSNLVDIIFPDCREFQVGTFDSGGIFTPNEEVLINVHLDFVALSNLPQNAMGLHLTFVAGWETPEDVPQNIIQAVRVMVEHYNQNRSAVSTGPASHAVPMLLDALISPYILVCG